ncbi:hypothetical protein D029_4835A, partial [Vibrio parahaemolyticus 970107]
MTFFKKVLVV